MSLMVCSVGKRALLYLSRAWLNGSFGEGSRTREGRALFTSSGGPHDTESIVARYPVVLARYLVLPINSQRRRGSSASRQRVGAAQLEHQDACRRDVRADSNDIYAGLPGGARFARISSARLAGSLAASLTESPSRSAAASADLFQCYRGAVRVSDCSVQHRWECPLYRSASSGHRRGESRHCLLIALTCWSGPSRVSPLRLPSLFHFHIPPPLPPRSPPFPQLQLSILFSLSAHVLR